MNVNSVSIANDLWVDKAQRDGLVSAAQGYLGNPAIRDGEGGTRQGPKATIETLQDSGLPIGWHINSQHDTKRDRFRSCISFRMVCRGMRSIIGRTVLV